MYETTTKIYFRIAEDLLARIGTGDFFSGVVMAFDEDEGVECRLTCTVVVHRAERVNGRWGIRPIERVLPVWWEMRSYRDGVEIDNDFSFGELDLTGGDDVWCYEE
jgi:hypothetical protein